MRLEAFTALQLPGMQPLAFGRNNDPSLACWHLPGLGTCTLLDSLAS